MLTTEEVQSLIRDHRRDSIKIGDWLIVDGFARLITEVKKDLHPLTEEPWVTLLFPIGWDSGPPEQAVKSILKQQIVDLLKEKSA